MTELQPGDWAIYADAGYNRHRRYELVQVDKVKAKQAKSGRRTYMLSELTRVTSKEVGDKIVARLTSARGEAQRRERAAWDAYTKDAARILGELP